MAKKKKDEDAIDVNPFWNNLGIIQCSLREAKKAAMLCFECNHVPVFIGEAGTGKTALARQIAKDQNWDATFLFLAHLEPEDIGGIPYPDADGLTYRFLCEETMKKVIENPKPSLLTLDEWNRGEKSTMSAAFTLMEDRRFGGHRLPDHVKIMACMNPSEGNYLVNEAEKDPAFRRRLCFIGIRTDASIWLDYARGRGKFHSHVVEFIQASPKSLTDTQAREAGKIYANPASWEKVSQTLQYFKDDKDLWKNESIVRIKLGGHIGAGMAEQFLNWTRENTTLINPEDVLKDYKKLAQKRVQKLVKKGKSDIIGELCSGLALAIMTQKIDASKIAPHIGTFSSDLPEDIAMGFFQEIANQAKSVSDPEYFVKLSGALSTVEDYNATLQRIQTSQERVEEEEEKSKKNKGDDNDTENDS